MSSYKVLLVDRERQALGLMEGDDEDAWPGRRRGRGGVGF